MTTEEQLGFVNGLAESWIGWDPAPGFFAGTVLAVPRLGIPAINAHDAGQGFRTTQRQHVDTVTSWPSGLALAATWDLRLTRRYGEALAREFRAKGANAILAPSLDIARVAMGGRNGESLCGEEPLLCSTLGPEYVQAVQGGGVACVAKHFALNTQETNRNDHSNSAHQRARWEVHYAPFEAVIKAGVASIMCSYNKVDGKYACENAELLNDDLKGRLGFEGWVMSDWWAVKNTWKAASSGVDQNMPGSLRQLSADALGRSRMRKMVRRILFGMISSTAFDHPACTPAIDSNCPQSFYDGYATSPEHVQLAREVGASSIVMLKNADLSLPLNRSARIAVVGSACDAVHKDLESLEWYEGDYYVIGGSGRVLSTRAISVKQALISRGVAVVSSNTNSVTAAIQAMRSADAIVACGGATSGEHYDRKSLKLDQHDFLVRLSQRVMLEKKNMQRDVPLIILTMSTGAVLTDFAPEADAVLSAFLLGQETGNAFSDVLLGDVSPSGKLPVTFPLSEADTYPICHDEYCHYDDGLEVGWRSLIGRAVAYPFGHGLSFTDFAYSWGGQVMSEFNESDGLTIKVDVQNIGHVTGAEIVQLYMRFPDSAGEPEQVLRGFKKTSELLPGSTDHLIFKLSLRDISVWRDCRTWSAGEYVGCFKDSVTDRDLRVQMKAGDRSSCERQCSDYEYYGRQWKQECFCGNSYGKHGNTSGCKCEDDNIGGAMNCVYRAPPNGGNCVDGWIRIIGEFEIMVGSSSRDLRLNATFVSPI
jgi:beta-glucosidase